MHNDKIFLDVETTGLLEPKTSLLVQQPYMIELYAARTDSKNKVLDEIETFVHCPIPIPAHITKITGIEENMLLGAPGFMRIYPALVELFIGTREIIAHNLPFDAGILWVELARLGLEFNFPWPPIHYCTIEHSYHLENKRLKLSALHEYATGSEYKEGAHRAKQDVLALMRCYKWMKKNDM